MFYEKLFLSVFGPKYKYYIPVINNVNLYCIFVITIILGACAYSIQYYKEDCENSFIERVKTLRIKYEH